MKNRWRCDHCQKFINESHFPRHLEGVVSDGVEFNYCICQKCCRQHGDDRDYWDKWVQVKQESIKAQVEMLEVRHESIH